MVILTDRQEIASAMNFGKYPVIRIDMETPKRGYEGLFYGDRVEVMTPTADYPYSRENGNLIYTADDERFSITANSMCLHADFGYSDVIEELKWAQAPKLHAGDVVVVIEDYPIGRYCVVHMMKVPEHIAKFTTPCCKLEELPDDFKLWDK